MLSNYFLLGWEIYNKKSKFPLSNFYSNYLCSLAGILFFSKKSNIVYVLTFFFCYFD